jgi:hypothetical protein
MRSTKSQSGIIVLLSCILLLLVMTFTLVVADQAVKDSSRKQNAGKELKEIYEGIVGNPSLGTFGYLGDVGDYPSGLLDLVSDPGLTGWNGPYVRNVKISNGVLYDDYGSPLEFFTNFANGSRDQITVISRGRDHTSTNGAANPNVDSQFTGTLPNSGSYSTANPDNEVFPDFYTSLNYLNRENAGTLSYDIRNYDQNSLSNAKVDGCPGLYSVNITSVPRGSADSTTLTYPSALYAQDLSAQLLQGTYDVAITSQTTVNPIWRERVSILPGAAVLKTVIAPYVDSSAIPGKTLTIFNNGSNTATVRVYGSSQGTVSTGTPIKQFTGIKACSLITITQGANTWDTFLMPYGNYTRPVKNAGMTTWSLTVTNGGTNDDVIQVVHTGHPGYPATAMVLGTVYKRKTVTFAIPATTNTNIPVGNRGTLIEYRRQDGTVISSPTITANTNVTVP